MINNHKIYNQKGLIQKLRREVKRLKAKLKPNKSFVSENSQQFESLINVLQQFSSSNGKKRYFFERKTQTGESREVVFKLNLLVSDLLEFKARTNVGEDQVNSRISMDKGSLIRFLSEGRVKRPRKK